VASDDGRPRESGHRYGVPQTGAAAVERFSRRVDSGVAAVFCHGGVFGVCVDKATASPWANRRDPQYGPLTRIDISSDGQWLLRTYNEIQHVERLAVP